MILQQAFRVPVEEGLFERALMILKEEFGLVEGRIHPKEGSERCLVWEDETGVGRYRVHCYGNSDRKGMVCDDFVFHYWDARMKEEILRRDPMKPALDKILSEAQNPIPIEHMYRERSLDQLFPRP